VGSFVPQMFTLFQHKNLDGVSGLTMMLNYLSNLFTTINTIILYWYEVQCCKRLSAVQCIGNMVPMIQLSSSAVCTFIIFTQATAYSGRNRMTDEQKVVQDELTVNRNRSATDYIAFIFGTNGFIAKLFVMSLIGSVILFCIGAALMVFVGIDAKATSGYAKGIGLGAILFLMVMYIPQLYTTYKVKHSGTLSVTSLLIQCPGSLAVVYFAAIQSHLDWTTWSPYLASASQQAILLIMCLYYFLVNRNKKKEQENEPLMNHRLNS